MIQLNSELIYNTELPFEEQSYEVKEFINVKMNAYPPIETTEPAGAVPRVLLQEWDFGVYKVYKQYYYRNPADSDMNGLIAGILIKVKQK